jgi:hypothetical protein
MSHGTAHGAPPDIVARSRDARRVYDNATAQITYREPAEVSRFLDGFSLVEPGLVQISQWRPAEPGRLRVRRFPRSGRPQRLTGSGHCASVLAILVAEIDNAEPVPVGIFQHDEVRILREAIPVDPPGAERHEPVRLCLLLADVGGMQVEVQARVILRQRLAELQGNRRPGSTWRHENARPSTEPILAQRVAEGR